MEKAGSQALSAASMSSSRSASTTLTFVHTDATNFRELVQRLTGVSDHPPSTSKVPSSPSAPTLYERRQCPRPKLQIMKPAPFPFKAVHSPSRLFPIATTTTVAAAMPSRSFSDLSNSDSDLSERDYLNLNSINREEEERAIKERRFYLHPSPRSRSRPAVEPELLTLFPLSSPNTTHHQS